MCLLHPAYWQRPAALIQISIFLAGEQAFDLPLAARGAAAGSRRRGSGTWGMSKELRLGGGGDVHAPSLPFARRQPVLEEEQP